MRRRLRSVIQILLTKLPIGCILSWMKHRPWMKHRRAISMIAAALVAALAGCQQTTSNGASRSSLAQSIVPIEEAKRTLAEFNKVEIKAPPRSTRDILILLDNAQDPNSEQRKKLIIDATEKIPAAATNHEILVASVSRSRAAGSLGWNGRQLKDLRRALDLIDRFERGDSVGFTLDPSFRKSIRRDAAWTELSDGNFERAAKLFRSAASSRDGGCRLR